MKTNSKHTHKSFVLSDIVSGNKKRQVFANILLVVILGIQIYNLFESIKMFDTIKFM